MDFKIAYQLYSARDIFDDNVIPVLKKLKEFGYDGVEPAGFYGLPTDYFRGVCDAVGLEIMSIHLSFWTLTENLDDTVRFLKSLGCRRAAIPGAFDLFIGNERYPYFLKNFSALGKRLHEEGIDLMYHNHGYEFELCNGDTALDVLYNSLDPEYVKAEIDCGFATYKGQDVPALIKRYKGRAPVLHLKDFNFNEGIPDDFSTFACPVGEGALDLPEILKAATFAGTEWLVVEQDSQSWRGLDQMQCAERSVTNLRKLIG